MAAGAQTGSSASADGHDWLGGEEVGRTVGGWGGHTTQKTNPNVTNQLNSHL